VIFEEREALLHFSKKLHKRGVALEIFNGTIFLSFFRKTSSTLHILPFFIDIPYA
jgi:hypothetical protein